MKKKIFLKIMLCVLKKVVFLQPQIQRGAVAQLVEQRTENPCVTGSTPVSATPSKGSRKWSFFLLWVVHTLSIVTTQLGVFSLK